MEQLAFDRDSGMQELELIKASEDVVQGVSASRNGHGNGELVSSKKSKIIPGEDSFNRLIAEAEYEVNVDPYRGLRFFLNRHGSEEKNDPDNGAHWLQCMVGSTTQSTLTDDLDVKDMTTDELDVNSVHNLVCSVCRCSCRSIISWTERAKIDFTRKINNKRKRKKLTSETESRVHPPFGSRPPLESKYKCPCDYNMFCLVSLGGVMNEFLNKKYENYLKMGVPDVIVVDETDETDETDKKLKRARDQILNPKSELYPDATSEKLCNVRKSQLVVTAAIRRYLSETLQGLTSFISVDDYITTIHRQHQLLLFKNPLLAEYNESKKENNTKVPEHIELSIPPGIENLGATCYLNTQLQCLAQNRVFVDGILSWRPPVGDNIDQSTNDTSMKGNQGKIKPDSDNPSDRMISVISLFQQLLARMNAGPCSNVSTIDFSDALGLDHHEQQDPNEFSRLLFERLHDSFQQGTRTRRTPNCQGDLANLLPHLFEGVIEYTTQCTCCLRESKRTEKFMDLNLPIVRQPKTKVHSGQQKIDTAFSAKLDESNTDVQYCLDQYCSVVEWLLVDNQYYCDVCNCKQDARRSSSFKKLPPVLNIQLSRYVFDRKKFIKQKKTDRVLLPTELVVSVVKHDGDDNEINIDDTVESKTFAGKHTEAHHSTKRYTLCAVMRHQGASAYSGHYVAEAMDWMTGQWFEFNDEKVTILECGPSCSYKPVGTKPTTDSLLISNTAFDPKQIESFSASDRKGQNGSLIGSQDAYNMYYVEESFLAQNALDNLKKENPGNLPLGSSLDLITMERSKYYSDLAQLCIDAGKTAEILKQRRDCILYSMEPEDAMWKKTISADDLVWVDGNLLRSFISCTRKSLPVCNVHDNPARPIGLMNKLLCPHQKLDPRTARRGKILPADSCNDYCAVLQTELDATSSSSKSQQSYSCFKLTDISVRAGRIICDRCGDEYSTQLRKKLDRVRLMKDVFDALIQQEGDFGLEPDLNETLGNEIDRYAYAVSKKFAHKFRSKMQKLMKTSSFLSTGTSDGSTSTDGNIQIELSVCEGLDGLNLSEFESESFNEEYEDPINSNITCIHGNFRPSSKNSYFYVPFAIWRMIKTLFPAAIEHKKRRIGFDTFCLETLSEYNDPIESLSCQDCSAEGQAEEKLRSHLFELVTYYKENDLSFESPTFDQLVDSLFTSTSTPGTHYRIVHTSAIESFQNFRSLFNRKLSRNRDGKAFDIASSIISPVYSDPNVPRSLRISSWTELCPVERDRLELISSMFRTIVCQSHCYLLSAVVSNFGESNDHVLRLNNDFRIMEEKTYQHFMANFVAIVMILVPDGSSRSTALAMSSKSIVEDAKAFCMRREVDKLHPKFCFPARHGNDGNRLRVTGEYVSGVIEMEFPVCTDEKCNEVYVNRIPVELYTRSEKGQQESASGILCSTDLNGGGASNPIGIDSDNEDPLTIDVISLQVLDVKSDACLHEVIQSLLHPSGADDNKVYLRRSSRTRKTRYVSNDIMEEETIQVNVNNNIASLRLLLLEQCTKGTVFSLDHNVTLVAIDALSASNDPFYLKQSDASDDLPVGSTPGTIDLSFELLRESLRDVCGRIPGSKDILSTKEYEQNFVLLRQACDYQKLPIVPKEDLMSHFLELANTTCDTCMDIQSTGPNKHQRKRKTERGFMGTVLSSGLRTSAPEENLNKLSNDFSLAEKNESVSIPDVNGNIALKPPPSLSQSTNHSHSRFGTSIASTEPKGTEDDVVLHLGGNKREWVDDNLRKDESSKRSANFLNVVDNQLLHTKLVHDKVLGKRKRDPHRNSSIKSIDWHANALIDPKNNSKQFGDNSSKLKTDCKHTLENESMFSIENLKPIDWQSPQASNNVPVRLHPQIDNGSNDVIVLPAVHSDLCKQNEKTLSVIFLSSSPKADADESIDSDSGSELSSNPFDRDASENVQLSGTCGIDNSITEIVSHNKTKSATERTDGHDTETNDDLICELTKMLLQNSDIKSEQEGICFIAAEKAVKLNPNERNLRMLLDSAYAIILQEKY